MMASFGICTSYINLLVQWDYNALTVRSRESYWIVPLNQLYTPIR